MAPELHGSLFDSWLLSNFPGRTLEELDNMNVLRYMRAMDARGLESVERLRADILESKKKSTDVPKEEYEAIEVNDKLWEEYQQAQIKAFLGKKPTWQI